LELADASRIKLGYVGPGKFLADPFGRGSSALGGFVGVFANVP
jgi:hypothetical protein